ncbi:A24 family peptidase [Sneathiella limimaris]|uniref:A24 family peptidase n=1 Tax=Sneathiella limimaris TaxID=1964213 RepID=UPI00146D2DC4|nr:prepilin peptidase [Sneathiella limimaris]
MLLDAIYLISVFAALSAALYAAYSDWKAFTIPNAISIVLVVLFPIAVLTAPQEIDWIISLATFGVVFIVGFLLFALGVFGGGDVKLIAALSLWSGLAYIIPFLIVTVLSGGLLVFVVIIREALRKTKAEDLSFNAGVRSALRSKTPVPYGVAIAIGSLPIFYFYIKNSGFAG